MIIDLADFVDWLQDLPEDARKRFQPEFTNDEIYTLVFAAELLVTLYVNSLRERNVSVEEQGRHLHLVVSNKGE
ncbi:MAG: hypothetical protein ACYDG6_06845 [Thermincolia bacterium]